MKKQIDQLIEFHTAFNAPMNESPQPPNLERQKLRAKLLVEEVFEFSDECAISPDLEKVAKELADIAYVLFGTVIEYGLQHVFEQVFSEVHRSNMSKLGQDGKPVYRGDGKVLKGENYSPADLRFLSK